MCTTPAPLQNRVHADGSLVANQARGTLMGNRGGRIHDPATRTLKTGNRWANRQWISCVLEFKGRARDVWGEGYSELFFLDEVTALSAGHRPCFECRRTNAKAFQAALFTALGKEQSWESPPKVMAIDRLLHEARVGAEVAEMPMHELPVGAMYRDGGQIFARTGHGVRPWSFEGYGAPQKLQQTTVHALTPMPILAALGAGYTPLWHDSAGQTQNATV